jgi:hypothetical protein
VRTDERSADAPSNRGAAARRGLPCHALTLTADAAEKGKCSVTDMACKSKA